MQCLNPTQAWIVKGAKTKNGRKVIVFNLPSDGLNPVHVNLRYQPVSLPCGKCILCRKRRSFAIGIRALKEATCHKESSFITLTVDDDHLHDVFPGGRLSHKPFQLFMKRLRKRLNGRRLRFLMCGEYGEHTHRPHYHVILFGFSPPRTRSFDPNRLIGLTDSFQGPDNSAAGNSAAGNPAAGNPAAGNPAVGIPDSYFDTRGVFHASRLLEDCWSVDKNGKKELLGHVRCDPLNENRVFYVAGYQLKDDGCGEWPSYVRWSRRPGLGADWFDRFWKDMYVLGRDENGDRKVDPSVVLNRSRVPFSCRYFDERLGLHDKARYDILRACREKVGSSPDPVCDNTEIQKFMLKALMNKADVVRLRLAKRKRDLD